MDALSHASFAPRRVTLSEVVAKLKGFLPNALIEPKPLTPEEMAAIREDLGRELATLEDEGKRDLPRLAAAEVKARKQFEALRPAFRAAEAALAKASGDHFRRAHDLQYAEENVRRRIAAVADPVIDEFMADVTDLFHASLGQQVEFELRGEYYDFTTLRRYAEVWTDAPSRFAFRKALLAARNQAEAMKSDPDQADIRERLAAILDALPDASVKVKKVRA